ncbi:hypothetical protein C8N43_2440 [Litoreibacter ponti]|uniref:Secreted protein n=1 Tax=Litoreibacter ponti TaxID=1510457 RepID=A0A2T6BNV8_9RHOB|nr:VPLPA-CTERM sorting domain-containing protein [Litoreibacter ponti]PTX57768.1 hypothetical protein C8N43_2440 [Litoreibacter ponti]
MRGLFLASIFIGLFVSVSSAATFNSGVRTTAEDLDTTDIRVVNNQDRGVSNFLNPIDDSQAASLGRADAAADLEVDPTTGIFKLGSSATFGPGAPFRGRATSSALISVSESFSATTAGQITFLFDFDGMLSASGPNSSTSFSATLRATAFASGSNIFQRQEARSNNVVSFLDGSLSTIVGGSVAPPADVISIDQVIQVTLDLNAGQSFGVLLSLNSGSSGSANGGSGTSDFLSTGYLSYVTSDGFSFTQNTPSFLSNAEGRPSDEPEPDPVPLPATLPLLIAGLVGLRALRKRAA